MATGIFKSFVGDNGVFDANAYYQNYLAPKVGAAFAHFLPAEYKAAVLDTKGFANLGETEPNANITQAEDKRFFQDYLGGKYKTAGNWWEGGPANEGQWSDEQLANFVMTQLYNPETAHAILTGDSPGKYAGNYGRYIDSLGITFNDLRKQRDAGTLDLSQAQLIGYKPRTDYNAKTTGYIKGAVLAGATAGIGANVAPFLMPGGAGAGGGAGGAAAGTGAVEAGAAGLSPFASNAIATQVAQAGSALGQWTAGGALAASNPAWWQTALGAIGLPTTWGEVPAWAAKQAVGTAVSNTVPGPVGQVLGTAAGGIAGNAVGGTAMAWYDPRTWMSGPDWAKTIIGGGAAIYGAKTQADAMKDAQNTAYNAVRPDPYNVTGPSGFAQNLGGNNFLYGLNPAWAQGQAGVDAAGAGAAPYLPGSDQAFNQMLMEQGGLFSQLGASGFGDAFANYMQGQNPAAEQALMRATNKGFRGAIQDARQQGNFYERQAQRLGRTADITANRTYRDVLEQLRGSEMPEEQRARMGLAQDLFSKGMLSSSSGYDQRRAQMEAERASDLRRQTQAFQLGEQARGLNLQGAGMFGNLAQDYNSLYGQLAAQRGQTMDYLRNSFDNRGTNRMSTMQNVFNFGQGLYNTPSSYFTGALGQAGSLQNLALQPAQLSTGMATAGADAAARLGIPGAIPNPWGGVAGAAGWGLLENAMPDIFSRPKES